jgi:hypothetical protein
MMVARRRIRPIGIIFIEIIILLNALWNGMRLGNAIFFWSILNNFGAPWLYLAISGGFWTVSSAVISVGLWQRKIWAWAGTIGGIIAYSVWYWADRLIFQLPHSNELFALLYTFIMIAFSFSVLFSIKTRVYFNLQKITPMIFPRNPEI